MSDITILRFVAHEGPGYLGDYLQQHHIDFHIIKVDKEEPIPSSVQDMAGLVLMGGPMSVNDPLPWIAPCQDFIREALNADIPVLGHCLGAQLIATVLGSAVTANNTVEIGWHPVSIVDHDSVWLQGLPEHFNVFHWHGETFDIPNHASHILSSNHCANQGFTLDKCLALQCHVEMTTELVHRWIEKNATELKNPTETVQSSKTMTKNLDDKIGALQKIADVFYQHWCNGLS